MRTTRTMTLCAPYARMKLQMNPTRLSFVTSVGKVQLKVQIITDNLNCILI